MIGLAVMPAATTGSAASWTDQEDGSDTHLSEPNVIGVRTGGAGPAIFGIPRIPVEGLRAIVTRLARTGIPRLPTGPSQVAMRGQGMHRVGGEPKRIQAIQQFVPVAGVDSTPDWYEYLR